MPEHATPPAELDELAALAAQLSAALLGFEFEEAAEGLSAKRSSRTAIRAPAIGKPAKQWAPASE